MSFYFPNVDPTFIFKRTGTNEDPYIFRHETHQINNSTLTLLEIPNPVNKVIVKKLDNTALTEVTSSTLLANQYRVDYSTGIVYFHTSLESVTVTCDFYGMGMISFPSSRVWVDTNDGSSIKTLQQAFTDIDNLKTNWLTAVSNYASITTTYTNPKIGDTVQTVDDSKIYRFNGSVWVNTQQYSANALTNVQNKIGDVNNLGTSVKDNLVNALNEQLNTIGNLSELTTNDKTNLVKAINSNNALFAGKADVKKVKGIVNIADYGSLNADGIISDQTVLAIAVADAKSKGYTLNWGWDNKTYLTTASIPDFHNVKHIGNAIIKRGTDLFYLSPTGTQRNKIYVAVTGSSNTFDGLSASQPVAKVQQAFDWIANYSPILTGYWEVVLTAGTFVNRAVLKAGLRSENPIEITGYNVGTYPIVPTTIISEGVGAAAVGIFASDGSKIKVTNVKFTGFNGSTSSAGIKVANGSELETSNCHFDSCYWGVSGEGRSRTVIPDGIFNNCGYLNTSGGTGAGIRSLQINNHQIGIQNNGNQTNTALFQNCYQAVLAQESSTGHVDWCTIQDCVSGIVARVNARVNMDGTSFKRNTTDVRADANGHVYVTSNSVFGTGADESTNKVVTSSGGNVTNSTIVSGKDLAYTVVDKTLDMVYTNQTVNTTSNTKVYTATLKAPFWKGTPSSTTPMKKMYVRVFGVLNGTNSNKSLTIRLGSVASSVTFTATETGTFMAEGWIYFNDIAKQYVFLKASRHLGTTIRLGRGNGTNPMTADIDLTVESQVDNVLDNVVIEMVEIGLAG